MQLKKLTYSEFEDAPKFWSCADTSFQKINLLVGRNATGKTRLLHVINSLGQYLTGKNQGTFISGNYDCQFIQGSSKMEYRAKFGLNKVIEEYLSVNGKLMLERSEDGSGKMWYDKENIYLDMKIPPNVLAIANKRDALQHSYVEMMHAWATETLFFYFGSSFNTNFIVATEREDSKPVDVNSQHQTVATLRSSIASFGQVFIDGVRDDMASLDYYISDIGLQAPEVFTPPEGMNIQGLYVQEQDLKARTEQMAMSQGMYRALSLCIHLNAGILNKRTKTLLIDDIGEGLDFERSSALIKLIVARVEASDMQVIMTSNDRFVMNNVPLRYWSILQRSGQTVKAMNIENSGEAFEDFKFTGMNNFDFFVQNYEDHRQ